MPASSSSPVHRGTRSVGRSSSTGTRCLAFTMSWIATARVLASTPEDRVANHALDNNATSIGIELVHEGDRIEPFGKRQIDALIGLLKSIRSRHQVPIDNIKGHSEVDARTFACGHRLYRTKMDPGANFPWARVRAAVRSRPALLAKPARSLQPQKR